MPLEFSQISIQLTSSTPTYAERALEMADPSDSRKKIRRTVWICSNRFGLWKQRHRLIMTKITLHVGGTQDCCTHMQNKKQQIERRIYSENSVRKVDQGSNFEERDSVCAASILCLARLVHTVASCS